MILWCRIEVNVSRQSVSRGKSHHKTTRETPVVVYFATFVGGLLGYVIARIALDGYPHPLHWALGILSAILGYLAGWLWYRYQGDMI